MDRSIHLCGVYQFCLQPLQEDLPRSRSGEMINSLPAAGWLAALRGLCCAHKCADEFPFHFRSDGINIDSLAAQNRAGILNAVNSGWLNVDIFKTSRCKLGGVINIR